MSLARLKVILPPPNDRVDVPKSSQWKAVEKSLQFDLPPDYKSFVEAYGLGCIDGFFWTLNPVTQNKHLNLEKRIPSTIKEWSMLREKRVEIPYALFPDPEGLVPWAITENGDRVHWLRRSKRLVVVVEHNGLAVWDEFPLGTVEFLIGMLNRDITIRAFPRDFPGKSHRFFKLGEDYFEWLRKTRE